MTTTATAPLTRLLLQHFTPVVPADVPRLATNPDALAALLDSPESPRASLGMYWHAVPFLITGVAEGFDEPYRFFVEGGEIIGRTDGGEVRYLSPRQVAALARALKEEEPDELGLGGFDEARLDRRGIYPERWVRWNDNDHLGTMRELYHHMRELVRATGRKKQGLLVFLESEPVDEHDTDVDVAPPSPPAGPPAVVPAHPAVVAFRGEDGRVYVEADASTHPSGTPAALAAIDAGMRAAGMRHVGDLLTPDSPTDVLRAFVADDGTVGAIVYLSDYGVGGHCFYARLTDVLVASSNTFILAMKKFGFHADFLQDADPTRLRAAVLERARTLAKKHGRPATLEPTPAAVASLWEEQYVRCRRGA